ncbi:MAG: DoxX family protein [Bryobacteraceae bacterium]
MFLSEDIQNFLFPDTLGLGRFEKIGIPAAHFMGPFVAVVEVFFGSAVVRGLLTRFSAIPLLIVILVAIETTKIVMLPKVGFGAVAHDGRADYSMFDGISVRADLWRWAALVRFPHQPHSRKER